MVRYLGQPNVAPHCLSAYALYESVHKVGFKIAVVEEGADDFSGDYDRFSVAVNDTSLRRVDSLSLAHAVEVRAPFCQPKIMSIANQIISELKLHKYEVKPIIYKAAYGKLPLSFLNRPKQPFTLPITNVLDKKIIHLLLEK